MANEKEWEAIRLLIKRGRRVVHSQEFQEIDAGINKYLAEIQDSLLSKPGQKTSTPAPKKRVLERIKSWLT